MAWYYCNNGHAKPLLLQHPTIPPVCTHCRQPSAPTHNVVRYQRTDNDYSVAWDDTNGVLQLKVLMKVSGVDYEILLPDGVLSTDSTNIGPNVDLTPPGGGNWLGAVSSYGGGRLEPNKSVPVGLNTAKLKLGQNTPGNSFGLVHVMRRHPSVLNNMTANPQKRLDLTSLRDNLQKITAAPTPGVGVRKIMKQTQNSRYVIHGISATHKHALLIVDQAYKVITTYAGDKLGGLGQAPVPIRTW